jgi:hypothetical protein
MKIAFAMLVLAVSMVSISPGASAHHGDAGYDVTKLVTVKGTVTEFHFQNPHIEIFIDVKKDDQVEKWHGENGGLERENTQAWRRNRPHRVSGEEWPERSAPGKSFISERDGNLPQERKRRDRILT